MEFVLVFFAIGLVVWLYFKFRSPKPLDLSVLPAQFVVFDLETTGLDPTKHQIIEIGAVRVKRDSNLHDTFQTLVRVNRKLPSKIVSITGITDDLLASEGKSLESALNEFLDFCKDDRLVAFNADFDMAFLRNASAQFGLTIDNPVSCALKMARRAWPGRKSYRLVDLARDGNLSTKGVHRALTDCKLTMTVYASAGSKLRSNE